jgi:hypothetical protein
MGLGQEGGKGKGRELGKGKRRGRAGRGRGKDGKIAPLSSGLDLPVFRVVGRESSVHNWYVEGYLGRLKN